MQRQDNFREIARLKDLAENKTQEASENNDMLKQLDYDQSRAHLRVEETQKLIDARNYDLRNKQILLEDVQKEIQRFKDNNSRGNGESQILRKDNDKLLADIFEVRKEMEYQAGRNADMALQARDLEFRAKDKDDQVYILRKDLDQQKYSNSQMRDGNVEFLSEKDALEKHAHILQIQNEDITRELDKFVETDEQVRSQLDRRGRVTGLRSKNENELQKSYYRIEEVRSRSPQRRH